jgi:hypothetical protein
LKIPLHARPPPLPPSLQLRREVPNQQSDPQMQKRSPLFPQAGKIHLKPPQITKDLHQPPLLR